MYRLSKDYDLLYSHLIEGKTIICYVDYDFMHDGSRICRDICECKKFSEWNIQFQSRGFGYGGIDKFEKEDYNITISEKEYFKKVCKSLNVEWVIPQSKIKYGD